MLENNFRREIKHSSTCKKLIRLYMGEQKTKKPIKPRKSGKK
jgi:hypothetical protein